MKDRLNFEEFFSPLEGEDLESLFSEHNEKLRSLSASFFNRHYLLSVSSGLVRQERQAVFIKPLQLNAQKILVGLLWTALYGKNFRVVHWNLLFDVLLRTIQHDRPSWALMLILRLTATSKDARDLNTKLDPVRRIIGRKVDAETKNKLLKQLENALGVRLPQKDPKIEKLLDIERRAYRPRPPKLPQRKRGYDDKGHLPDETNPKVPASNELLPEKQDFFALLLRQTDQQFRFFYPS
jgi:hypothetical protein